ncbi:unnamed protein product [Schistosoma curassoni]|uniref:Uncharacterized protein n=1 Tax=Schistosoma curassoni TaxID=6186 RepID=A0A183JHS9_9TREM|nr:unnamed protein product [Schistosoma curassoni]
MHKAKSKIFRYNTTCNSPVTIDGEDLEGVKAFTYVGSIMDQHGGSDADVKARIGKARAAYLQLTNIWNSKQLSLNPHQSHNFQYKCEGSSTVWAESWRTPKVVYSKYFGSIVQTLTITNVYNLLIQFNPTFIDAMNNKVNISLKIYF